MTNNSVEKYTDTISSYRRIILILTVALLIILGWIILSNDLIKKTIIRSNASIYRTEVYQDYMVVLVVLAVLIVVSFVLIPVLAPFVLTVRFLVERNWKLALIAVLLGLYAVLLVLYF